MRQSVDQSELDAITTRLERVMKPDFIPIWLETSVPVLDGATPLEVLARGDYDLLSSVVAGLEYPGAT